MGASLGAGVIASNPPPVSRWRIIGLQLAIGVAATMVLFPVLLLAWEAYIQSLGGRFWSSIAFNPFPFWLNLGVKLGLLLATLAATSRANWGVMICWLMASGKLVGSAIARPVPEIVEGRYIPDGLGIWIASLEESLPTLITLFIAAVWLYLLGRRTGGNRLRVYLAGVLIFVFSAFGTIQYYTLPRDYATVEIKIGNWQDISTMRLELAMRQLLTGRSATQPGVPAPTPGETRLFIRNTRLSDDQLKRLATVPTLTMLDLTGCEVTDTGIAHLAGAPSLQELVLNETPVTDASIDALSVRPMTFKAHWAGTHVSPGKLAEWAGRTQDAAHKP